MAAAVIRPPWQRNLLALWRGDGQTIVTLAVFCAVFVSVSAWLLPPPPVDPCRGLVMADCGQR